MTFIHPVQDIVIDSEHNQVYVVIKNTIVAYRGSSESGYKLVGKWVDTYQLDQAKEKNENQRKKAKGNTGEAIEKKGKQEVPIAEALSLNSNIRDLQIFNDGKSLVACTDSNKGIVIVDIDLEASEDCLTVRKREQFAKRPNAITLTSDEKIVLMADKFGDVYTIDTTSNSTDSLNEERKPLLGHVSMLTDILLQKSKTTGKEYVITTDRDEHIKISNYPQSFVVDKWLFGHKEFISSIVSPSWRTEWLISAGGDESIFLWNWEDGSLLSTFDYSDLVKDQLNDSHLAAARFQNEEKNLVEYCVAKLATLENLPYVAFYVEATKSLFILQINKEDGTLQLKQTLELPYNIISLSQNENGFAVSLDNHKVPETNFVKLVKLDATNDSFTFDDSDSEKINNVILESLKSDANLNIESVDDIHPLYNIINLKKHGEAYS